MKPSTDSSITLHRADARGRTLTDWLDSWHSFSFGHFVDPARMGFGPLRVINEDVIAPGRGFDTHPHRDMEILTWVLSGQLEHQDSTGGGAVLRPGEVQRMSAGRGIRHREWNPDPKTPVHLLQIWLEPHTLGVEPRWEQRAFEISHGTPTVVAGPEGGPGLSLHQDARLSVLRLEAGARATLPLNPGRAHWIQTARGSVEVDARPSTSADGADELPRAAGSVPASPIGEDASRAATLDSGDALALTTARDLEITAIVDAELLLFDLPPIR